MLTNDESSPFGDASGATSSSSAPSSSTQQQRSGGKSAAASSHSKSSGHSSRSTSTGTSTGTNNMMGMILQVELFSNPVSWMFLISLAEGRYWRMYERVIPVTPRLPPSDFHYSKLLAADLVFYSSGIRFERVPSRYTLCYVVLH